MSTLFTAAPFTAFGPCFLHVEAAAVALGQIHGPRPVVLKGQVREQCPRQPGVYGMIDPHGELIYIGKAKNLRARLLSYFRPRSRGRKATSVVRQARSIVWEPCPDEFAALHRELELIRRWRPRCNVQGKPQSWQHTFVCLGRPPAPYAFLARRPPARALASFGPVLAGGKARAAMRWLNDQFQLRDCPKAQEMIFADEAELFPGERAAGCLRHELGTCLGPCAGLCGRGDYMDKVRAARAFLAGVDVSPLQRLKSAMLDASVQQQYERAAVLRDKFTALQWLHDHLDRIRRAEAMGTAVYPVQGHDGQQRWYVLHAGRAVAVISPHPRGLCKMAAAEVKELARERGGRARPGEWLAGVLLLASWLRRFPRERQALMYLHA